MREGVVSVTAQHVAAHRLRFERVRAPGRPGDDLALTEDVAAGVAVREGRLHEYLRARTAFVDGVVVDALDAGLRQVVVVAAGYDGRALRYAREGVRFVELDHPATQRDKRARLDRLGLDTAGVTFVALDVRTDDTAGALRAAGLDAGQPSCLVVEGLTSYLDDDVLARLLGALRDVAAPASTLALTLSRPRGTGLAAVRHAAFARRVAALGEPLRNDLDAVRAVPMLEAAGWSPRLAHPRHGFVVASTDRRHPSA